MLKGYTFKFNGDMTFLVDDEDKAWDYFWEKLESIGLGTGVFLNNVECEYFEEEERDD